jgi:hypothetical protein
VPGLDFTFSHDELGRMRRRVAARLPGALLFDPEEYLSLHDDLQRDRPDPYWHFAEWGIWEQRAIFSPTGVARALGRLGTDLRGPIRDYERRFEAAQTLSPAASAFRDSALIGVIHHTKGSHYMRPIAMALAHALERAGARCMLLTEQDPAAALVTCPIVVAPHEFFTAPLPPGLNTAEFRLRAVMYNTEQLPSQWFRLCIDLLFPAKGVIDINFQSALALGTSLPATHLLPPFNSELRDRLRFDADPSHPLFRSLPRSYFEFPDGGPLARRPIDLFFAGYKTPGREQFFSRAAPMLADRECFLAYSDLPDRAAAIDEKTLSLFPSYLRLAAATKIILNTHRYPIGFFEWERMIAQGFSSGAAVVATPCMRAPFFEDGVHYFEAVTRNLDKLLAWLLDEPDGQRAAQAAADASRSVVETQLTPERSGRFLLDFLAGLEGDQ